MNSDGASQAALKNTTKVSEKKDTAFPKTESGV